MNGIVKRLRERNFSVFDGIERRMSDPLSGEAADEIERLKAQVAHAKTVISDLEYHWVGKPEDLWGPLREPQVDTAGMEKSDGRAIRRESRLCKT